VKLRDSQLGNTGRKKIQVVERNWNGDASYCVLTPKNSSQVEWVKLRGEKKVCVNPIREVSGATDINLQEHLNNCSIKTYSRYPVID